MHSFSLPDPETQPEFYDSVAMKRFFAWVVDSVLIVILTLIAIPFTAFTGLFYFPILWLVIGFLYRVILLATRSGTFGMHLMSIELRKSDGEKLDSGTAFLHTAGYSIAFSSVILQIVSVAMMLVSQYGQSLPDMVLGTVAVNKRN